MRDILEGCGELERENKHHMVLLVNRTEISSQAQGLFARFGPKWGEPGFLGRDLGLGPPYSSHLTARHKQLVSL